MTLKIDADFPGGNIVVERIEGDDVYVHQDIRDTKGDWFYWCFRVSGAEGKKLNFHFTRSNCIGVRGPGVSLDKGITWKWLGADAVKQQSFSYDFDKSAGEVRFSFAMQYQQEHLERFLAKHKDSPFIKKDTLCVTRKGRKVELLHVGGNPKNTKFKMLITARHHCCEMIANFVHEGIIETAIGDSDTGRWFRDNVDLVMVPFADKDGVEDGDQGKNRIPRDHGRDYAPPHVHVEPEAMIKFVKKWTKEGPDIGIDIHCPHIRGNWNENIYIVGGEDPENLKEEMKLAGILADTVKGTLPYDRKTGYLPFGESWNTTANYSGGIGFRRWVVSLPGTKLGCSFEVPYANVQGVEVNAKSARAFGHDLAETIRKYVS